MHPSLLTVFALVLATCVLSFAAVGCGGDADTATPQPETEQPLGIDENSIGKVTPKQGDNQAGAGSGEELSDEEKITLTIEAFYTSNDPLQVCEQAVTDRFLRQAYGDLAGCQTAQGQGGAGNSVGVEGISINGNTAVATALPVGGPADGEETAVELKSEQDAWRISGLRSNAPVGP